MTCDEVHEDGWQLTGGFWDPKGLKEFSISVEGGRRPLPGPDVTKFWKMPIHFPREQGRQGQGWWEQGTTLEPPGLLAAALPWSPANLSGFQVCATLSEVK